MQQRSFSQKAVSKREEPTPEVRQFDYSLRHRIDPLFLLVMTIVISALIFAVVALSFASFIMGGEVFSRTEFGAPGELIFGIIISTFFILNGLILVIATPAIQVSDDGFRIKRLFYTSPWLSWQDICDTELLDLSSLLPFNDVALLVGAKGLSPIFGFVSFIGPSRWSNVRGFIINDRLQNYSELIEILQTHRPDLFD